MTNDAPDSAVTRASSPYPTAWDHLLSRSYAVPSPSSPAFFGRQLEHRTATTVVAARLVNAAVLVLLRLPVEGACMLTTAWCFVPVTWGLWAMLAPSRWVPSRLSAWGAILGVVAGLVAGPVLNLPLRMGAPSGGRWIALVVGPILYYLLWLLVGVAYRSLHVLGQPADTASAGSAGH